VQGTTGTGAGSLWRLPAVRSLAALTVLGFLSYSLLISALPAYAAAGGAGLTAAGSVTTALLVTTVLAQGTVPAMVRRHGLGRVLTVGLLALGLPAPLYLVADDVRWLAAVSAVRGIGFAVLTVLGSTIAARAVPAGRRGEHAVRGEVGEALGVAGGDPRAAFEAGGQARQPVQLEGGEHLVEAAVPADPVVQEAVDAVLPVVAQHPHGAAERGVPGDDDAALPRGAEGLDLDERVDPCLPGEPRRHTAEHPALRHRGVLHEPQAAVPGEGGEPRHVGHHGEDVRRHQRLRPRGDPALHVRRVDDHRQRVDVGEDRPGAERHDGARERGAAEGGDDHLVTGPDVHRGEHEREGGGAAAAGHHVGGVRAQVLAQGGLEAGGPLAEDELLLRARAGLADDAQQVGAVGLEEVGREEGQPRAGGAPGGGGRLRGRAVGGRRHGRAPS
jgi:hypothetical protein